LRARQHLQALSSQQNLKDVEQPRPTTRAYPRKDQSNCCKAAFHQQKRSFWHRMQTAEAVARLRLLLLLLARLVEEVPDRRAAKRREVLQTLAAAIEQRAILDSLNVPAVELLLLLEEVAASVHVLPLPAGFRDVVQSRVPAP